MNFAEREQSRGFYAAKIQQFPKTTKKKGENYNLATIPKDIVTNDTNRARDGQFYKMAARQEGKVANLLNFIRHFITGVIEGVAAAHQFLTILGIAHIVFVKTVK